MGILSNIGLDEETMIREWLNEHCTILSSIAGTKPELKISFKQNAWVVDGFCSVDFKPVETDSEDKKIKKNISLTNGRFEWGEVHGNVMISDSDNVSFKGAPKRIFGDVYLDNCKEVKTLKGFNSYIHGDFYIKHCNNILSLKGGPKKLNGQLIIHHCKRFRDLSNCPSQVLSLRLSNLSNLRNLKNNIQRKIKSVYIKYCENLISLEGLENLSFENAGAIRIESCPIKSIEGINPSFDGDLVINNCWALETLYGCPKMLNDFSVLGDAEGPGAGTFPSLEGGPQIIQCSYSIINAHKLVSFKGAPQKCTRLFLGDVPGPKHFIIRGEYEDLQLQYIKNLENFEGSNKILNLVSLFRCHNLKNLDGIGIEKRLVINECKGLQTLKGLELSESTNSIEIRECTKLRSISNLPKACHDFYCYNCPKIHKFPNKFIYIDYIKMDLKVLRKNISKVNKHIRCRDLACFSPKSNQNINAFITKK